MSIQFQSLFTIQVLHDYYDRHQNRCNDFDIVPTADCQQLMKNLQILHKNYNHRLLTVVNASKEVNDTPPPAFKLSPFIGFHPNMVLRFYLIPKNPHFGAITAAFQNFSQRRRLYFSNLSNNKSDTVLSLSSPLPVFSISKKYNAGDLVKGPDDKLYEAIRISDGTAESKDLSNPDYWLATPGIHPYVNKADEVVLAGSSYTYQLQTPATAIFTKIFGLNTADDHLQFDQLLLSTEQIFTQQQTSTTIQLPGLAPGKYRLVVNGEEDVWLYIDPDAVKQNLAGIIEIHHFEKVPADFRLLTAQNHIRIPETLYTIHFKNRSVIWQYTSQNGNIHVADSSPSPQVFLPDSGTTVRSAKAIALTESPVSTLTATKAGTGKQLKNLKNPEPQSLIFETKDNTGYYISNMYIRIDT